MFGDSDLLLELNSSSSLGVESKIFAEWNMNIPSNFMSIGNYRQRQQEPSSIYNLVPETFDRYDSGNYYTGATDADVLIDGGFDDSNQALAFSSKQEMTKILFLWKNVLVGIGLDQESIRQKFHILQPPTFTMQMQIWLKGLGTT